MNTKLFFKAGLVIVLAISLGFTGCKKDEENDDRLPARFKVDIPSSLRKTITDKSTNGDTLKGNDIYGMLGAFINIADGSANVVQAIITSIKYHNINKAMSISYTSNDDGRQKNLVVIENSNFDGLDWQFQLTITDALSESNADGGKAIQVFWNDNPIKGIAILKPYNIDRTKNTNYPNAMYRVDYSEAGEYNYDSHMIVSIVGLPLANPLQDPYSVEKLKLFAGKKGDNVDLYGNSYHPNAKFYTNETSFNWAFVASGNSVLNIAAAEVGIPSSSLSSTDRNVLLKDNSVETVLKNQINATWPGLDSTAIAAYLYNTEAPGFFNSAGFIQGGTSPGTNWDDLYIRTQTLSPYSPAAIKDLTISFK